MTIVYFLKVLICQQLSCLGVAHLAGREGRHRCGRQELCFSPRGFRNWSQLIKIKVCLILQYNCPSKPWISHDKNSNIHVGRCPLSRRKNPLNFMLNNWCFLAFFFFFKDFQKKYCQILRLAFSVPLPPTPILRVVCTVLCLLGPHHIVACLIITAIFLKYLLLALLLGCRSVCNDLHFSDLPKQIKGNAWLSPCQMFTAFPGKQILFVTYIKPEVNNASCRRQTRFATPNSAAQVCFG